MDDIWDYFSKMDDMSNPNPAKRRRIDDESDGSGRGPPDSGSDDDGSSELGPDDLDFWIRLERGRFDPKLRGRLLSSRSVDGRAVLSVVLRYVFGWGTAQYNQRRQVNEYECRNWMPGWVTGVYSPRPQPEYVDHFVMRCAVHDIGLRLQALEFVSEWLGADPPAPATPLAEGCSSGGGRPTTVPSLARLCAQRIAMDMFPSLVERVDANFDDMQLHYFEAALPAEMRSELSASGMPDHLIDEICEEVYVFVIVHLLYVDLRTLPDAPHKENELLLPGRYLSNGPRRASTDRRRRDIQNWWDNRALPVFDRAVPDAGRGSLAKVGIVSHAVRSNFGTLFPGRSTVEEESDRLGYCHVDAVLFMLFSGGPHLRVRHPLADGVALGPLALFLMRYLETGHHRYRDRSVLDKIERVILPWLTRTSTGATDDSELDAGNVRLVQSACLEFLPPFGDCAVVASVIQRCNYLWLTNVKKVPGSLVMNVVHEKSRARMQSNPYRCKHSNSRGYEETAILESGMYAFSSSEEFDSEGGVDGSGDEDSDDGFEGSSDEDSDENFELDEGDYEVIG